MENRKRKLAASGLAISLSKKMFQECLIITTVIDEEEHDEVTIRIKPLRIENYVERLVPNLSNEQFQWHFRLSRATYDRLLPVINELICKKTVRGRSAMNVEKQLLATLWLLATPDSYTSVGERFDMGKNSLSVAFFRVVCALNKLSYTVIKWPTRANIEKVKNNYYQIAGVDNVIGAIDGTLIPIKAPKLDPEVYITRKCDYAITLQAICNAQLKFTDRYVGYPGSVSDTRIFRNSDIHKDVLENPRKYFPNEEFIVGDKAYPVLSWCMPPYIDRGNLNASKRNFNHMISQTRQCIERSFALLFGRFRRLKYLDMNRTDLIPATVLACCVLHNLCLDDTDLHIDEYINEGINNVRENDNLERDLNDRILVNREGAYRKRDNLCALLYDLIL